MNTIPHIAEIITFDELNQKPLNILVVEDSASERLFLETHIRSLGHIPTGVKNGQEAIDILKSDQSHFDMVLMDRMMPVMDGIKAVHIIKETPELRDIAVIMLTSADSPEEMQDGLSAGVFYYLSKPLQTNTFNAVVSAVTREVNQRRMLDIQMRRHRTSFGQIHTCRFEFDSLEQAESIAGFMAQCFPNPERVITGLAELMINAVEHGLYEIGYDKKTELLDSGMWRAEIERRQGLPEYAGRKAEAIVTKKDNGVYAIITDNGAGFDWKNYLSIDPSRAGDNHGRGIAQAKAISFDHMNYNDTGNRVVVFVGSEPSLEW